MLVIDRNFNGSLSCDINDYPEGLVLVIDKPYRWTSADVIRKVKYAAIHHFAKKNLKVGHAGTLDPLATGILLVCIGNACKSAESFQASDKEYIAGVCFGATTPSYDLEKEVDCRYPFDEVNRENLIDVLPSFIGEQDQVAPLFSAKMVDGVRAYELARKLYKNGASLDEAASELLRVGRIRITEMELLDFRYSGQETLPRCQGPEGSVHPRTEVVGGAHPNGWEGLSPKGEVLQAPDTQARSASNRINVAQVPEGLPVASIRVACSKGTYVRALARDLGERMGSGAFLSSLQRSRSGQFCVENALSIEDILKILYI